MPETHLNQCNDNFKHSQEITIPHLILPIEDSSEIENFLEKKTLRREKENLEEGKLLKYQTEVTKERTTKSAKAKEKACIKLIKEKGDDSILPRMVRNNFN
jgi:hypothetical protein